MIQKNEFKWCELYHTYHVTPPLFDWVMANRKNLVQKNLNTSGVAIVLLEDRMLLSKRREKVVIVNISSRLHMTIFFINIKMSMVRGRFSPATPSWVYFTHFEINDSAVSSDLWERR